MCATFCEKLKALGVEELLGCGWDQLGPLGTVCGLLVLSAFLSRVQQVHSKGAALSWNE